MAKASSDNNGTLWGDLVQALRRCEGQRRVSQGTHGLIETANVPTGRPWWTQVQGAQTIDVVPKILQYGLALCGHGGLLLWGEDSEDVTTTRLRPLLSRRQLYVSS